MSDLVRLAGGVIHLAADAAAPAAFAAEQLAHYLARMSGRRPARRAALASADVWIALTAADAPLPRSPSVPAGAEWVIEAHDDAVAIGATTPRALLAGVYGLLEDAGCRWSPRGPAEEHVPSAPEARAVRSRVGRPAFARRAWASDLMTWHYTMPERLAERLPDDEAFIDWMAKSGGTGFLWIRHAHDTAWTVPALAPVFERRGLAIEVGGHVLPELLPRRLFAAHPEYFPMGASGTRTDCGNCCPSSTGALDVIRAEARAARAALPPGADFHLWSADLHGGGWCTCPRCASLTPSDQALRVSNAVAADGDRGRLFHLAYHDTLAPPCRERPHPCVWAEFAPRERCYGHALDDATCPTNPRYRAALEGLLAAFDGRVQVFEYYADAILFGGCAVPLVDVIGNDLAFYQRAGVTGVSCLTFGTYSLLAHGVNVAAFARGACDPAAAAGARPAGALGRYIAALEQLMAEAVIYGDVKLPPRDLARAREARSALRAALARAPTVRRLLAEVGDKRRECEQRLLDYTLATLGGVETLLSGEPAAVERGIALLEEALVHLRGLAPGLAGTWGRYDLDVLQAVWAAQLTRRTTLS